MTGRVPIGGAGFPVAPTAVGKLQLLYSGIDISYRFRYTFPGFLAADGDAAALTQSSAASTVVWEKFANYWDAHVVRHAGREPEPSREPAQPWPHLRLPDLDRTSTHTQVRTGSTPHARPDRKPRLVYACTSGPSSAAETLQYCDAPGVTPAWIGLTA